jgi:hypothetical protein
MWAIVNFLSNVPCVVFGNSGSGEYFDYTTTALTGRAVKFTPNMGLATCFDYLPILRFSIFDGFSNMLIWMSWHCLIVWINYSPQQDRRFTVPFAFFPLPADFAQAIHA